MLGKGDPGNNNIINDNACMGACHHPERLMSCSLLVVTEIVGIIRSNVTKIPIIGITPEIIFKVVAKSTHHQYSERLDLPLKSGARL